MGWSTATAAAAISSTAAAAAAASSAGDADDSRIVRCGCGNSDAAAVAADHAGYDDQGCNALDTKESKGEDQTITLSLISGAGWRN